MGEYPCKVRFDGLGAPDCGALMRLSYVTRSHRPVGEVYSS